MDHQNRFAPGSLNQRLGRLLRPVLRRGLCLLLGIPLGLFLQAQVVEAQQAVNALSASERAEGTVTGVPLVQHISPAGVAVAYGGAGGARAATAASSPITSAGRTAGQFSITPTGGAIYNIPIWVPPGARDIEPHLALRYISGGPDGALGPGWALSGISVIARCNQTWAANGAAAGVTLAATDDLCLDGSRLRLTSGTQGVAGSTYQTEIADFSDVTAYGASGTGPAYFVVRGKDGRSYEYGNTTDSEIFASGATTPYLWALNKISDRQGNHMVLSYSAGSAATPAKIQYTATPGSGGGYNYEVDFSYSARAGNTTISKYVAGGSVSQSNELDTIQVLSSAAPVRKYILSYSASATTNRPLLQSVQECAGSAGSDCLRPTTITYQQGGAGWSATATGTGISAQYGFVTVDLNGDGFPDALYGKLSGNNIHWYARLGSAGGYGSELDTGANSTSAYPIITGGFSGTPGTQFLSQYNGTWYVYTYNGSGFSAASTGVPVGSELLAIDWDGDGLPDLVSASGATVAIRRNTTMAGGAVSFAGTTQTVFTAPLGAQNLVVTHPITPADFNGDGRGDLLVRYYIYNSGKGFTRFSNFALLSQGFSTPPTQIDMGALDSNDTIGTSTALLGDWNGDGCTDIITQSYIRISNCAGGFTQVATGIPLITPQPFPYPISLVDVDGDGQMDLLYKDPSSGNWSVSRSTGTGIAAGVSTGVPAPSTQTLSPVDIDSDGQPDLVGFDSASGYAVNVYTHSAALSPPDLASSITDGFGITFSATYVAISHNNYTKGTDASFPDIDFQGPLYVVSVMAASDGTGGTYHKQFWYYQARMNLQGRGFEGFYTTRSYDDRNGVYEFDYFRRDFPYIGSQFEADTYQPDMTTLMQKAVKTYASMDLAGTACSARCFPYVSNSTTYHYEVGGAKNGALVSTASTTYTYDSYGNIITTNSTTTDNDGSSPFYGLSWNTVISNTISNDPSNWCLGRPSSTTTQKSAPGQATQTRRVDHTIDYSSCRATAEIVEPTDARLKVTTAFGYDNCGNVDSVSVVGLDSSGASMPARTTTTSFGTRCQFPESVTNTVGQTSTTAYQYDYGLKASSTDPNGITLSWQYDHFGRKTLETHPDSTSTTWSYQDCASGPCWGVGDLRFLQTETVLDSSGTTVRTAQQFYDGLDRLRYQEVNRVLGVWTITTTQYDNLGRKVYVYLPYSSASNGYHRYSYDLADRQVSDVLYDSSSNAYRTTSFTYLGQTVIVTDPKSNAIQKVTDVAGKLRRLVDPAPGGTTSYTYDPFGNLVSVQDADSIVSTYSYNNRGFKIGSHDADTGSWSFTPDSLNELVSQVDAKGQVTTFGYDGLGRMISRLEPESTTATLWTFGTSAAAHNIGKLQSVTKPDGYTESYSYDSAGRPLTTVYGEDGANYQFDYTYNSIGTVDTLTYPVSTGGSRFALKYVYDGYGYLHQLQDADTGAVFWTLNSASDSSLPSSESLGNGVQVASSYTPWTNEITERSEGSGGSTNNMQDLAYQWDLNGNLLERRDKIQNLQEDFVVDSLNRISTVALNGVQTLGVSYDAAGNITSKSDVGSYTYADPAHPHAVTSAGTWTIGYDANGNMNSRGGGGISTYSYDLPQQISFNGNSSAFSYNADHQRWKQVANYSGALETTHYVGGRFEVVTRGTLTEYRHQIPAGSTAVVHTRRSDCSTNTYYLTSDHLGSADLVFDSYGAIIARESFSAFGARRGSNWQGVPTTGDYSAFAVSSRRGFTGHEMLDSVSLVHMNGRVYDPYLGRFLSADTEVQSLGSSQSVNPYSYAWNDPLRYIDPSGHSLLGDIVGIIAAVVTAIFLPELAPTVFGEFGTAEFAATAIAAGFVGGFVGAAVSTGNLSAAFEAGVIGAITAGLTAGIGQAALADNWNLAEFVTARAAVGCLSAVMSEGNCGKGALSAAFALAAQPMIIKFPSFGVWSAVPESAEAGLLGGEAARIAGGKFEDGFSTAAVSYLAGFRPTSNGHADTNVLAGFAREVKVIVVDALAVAVGQVGLVVGFANDLWNLGSDVVEGYFSRIGHDLYHTLYDLIIPHYGWYGGAGWGTEQFHPVNGAPSVRPMNAEDMAAFVHDMSCPPCDNLGWVNNSWNPDPGLLPAGPFGAMYKLLGTIPFTLKGNQ